MVIQDATLPKVKPCFKARGQRAAYLVSNSDVEVERVPFPAYPARPDDLLPIQPDGMVQRRLPQVTVNCYNVYMYLRGCVAQKAVLFEGTVIRWMVILRPQ